jgi:hypothetical protein
MGRLRDAAQVRQTSALHVPACFGACWQHMPTCMTCQPLPTCMTWQHAMGTASKRGCAAHQG